MYPRLSYFSQLFYDAILFFKLRVVSFLILTNFIAIFLFISLQPLPPPFCHLYTRRAFRIALCDEFNNGRSLWSSILSLPLLLFLRA
jgi:hypothetical protein